MQHLTWKCRKTYESWYNTKISSIKERRTKRSEIKEKKERRRYFSCTLTPTKNIKVETKARKRVKKILNINLTTKIWRLNQNSSSRSETEGILKTKYRWSFELLKIDLCYGNRDEETLQKEVQTKYASVAEEDLSR